MAYQSSRDTRDDLLARIREWAQAKDEVQAWGRVLGALDAHVNGLLDQVARGALSDGGDEVPARWVDEAIRAARP